MRMQKKYLIVAAIALSLLLFVGVIGFRIQQKNEREASLKSQTPPPTAVAVQPPRQGRMASFIQLPGNVVAGEEVKLSPKVSGRLLNLKVEEGSAVRVGQLLGEIDHLELDAQLNQAKASMLVAKANLDQLLNGPLQTQIDQARASVRQLEASLGQLQVSQRQSQRDLERQKLLVSEGVITAQQYETTATQLEGLNQQIMAMQQQIAGANASLQQLLDGNRPEQIESARGQYLQAQASVQLYEAQLTNYRLISPIEGVVSQKHVDVGNLVAAPNPILTLVQNSNPKIELFLPERELPRVRLKQSLEVRSQALPDQVISAVITQISPVVDQQSRLIKLTAMPNDPKPLRAGMLLDCRLTLEERPNTLIVPAEAVITTLAEPTVYVAVDQKVEARPVKIGLRSPSEIEILEGLQAQEQVIVKGMTYVQPGDPIQIQPPVKEVL